MSSKKKFKLQGHEKFALRDGWLNKGIDIIPEIKDAFTRKDATDIFGIGSNMVKSLRYWMKVLGLTEANGAALSELGMIIHDYDPYFEKDFTLWLLQSKIAKNVEDATAWYMFFNNCDADGLDKEEIQKILFREIKKYVEGQLFSEKSLSNDIDVLVNMYSKDKTNIDPEDKSTSPFARLGLLKSKNGKIYKTHPNKNNLSEYVILVEISEQLLNKDSISIESVISGENGLSKIFNLTPVMVNDYLDKLDNMGYIRVDRTAGLDMVYPVKALVRNEIIIEFYRNN